MTINFPDFSSLNPLELVVREEDLLLEFALLPLSYQAQLLETPALLGVATEDGQWVEPGQLHQALEDWRQRSKAWWQEQARRVSKPLHLAVKLAMHCKLEVRLYNQQHPSSRERIEALMASDEADIGLVLLKTAERLIRLPGMWVVSEASEDDASSAGDFILQGAGWGLWYDSDSSRAALRLRAHLQDAACSYGLADDLRQAILDCEAPELVFSSQHSGLNAMMVDDLRDWQWQQVEQVIAQAQANGEQRVPVAELEAAVRLEPFIHRLHKACADYMGRARRAQMPAWLRGIDESAREALKTLCSSLDDLELQLQDSLGECSDLAAFSTHEIKQWLASELDVQVVPSALQIRVRHDFSTGDRPLTGERTCSLLEWVLSGGYAAQRLSVEPLDPALREILSQANLQRMIVALDLRARYASALAARYQLPDVRALLARMVDQRLLRALLVARHQGLAETAAKAVQDALNDAAPPAGLQVGRVSIMGHVLSGLLCFVAEAQYVLYAPGADGGDLQRFASLRQLSLALGALTGTAPGRTFLLERVPTKRRASFSSMFARSAERHDAWPTDEVELQWLPAQSWAQVRDRLVDDKVSSIMDDLHSVSPAWLLQAPTHLRQRLSDLENELRSVYQHLQPLAQPLSFQAYAREQVGQRLNSFPGAAPGWLDPDDLMISLDAQSEMTFTQLVIQGYEAHVNFEASARLRCVTGQDISGLNVAALGGYVRAARLGERYIEQIQRAYLAKDRPQGPLQLELHRLMLGLKMQRDCLAEVLRGELSKAHATWLTEVCMHFDERSLVEDCLLSELWLGGCRVEDAYVLHDPAARGSGSLLYLANAPGERPLLTPLALAEAWRDQGFADYFLQRVAYKDRGAMAALVERQLREGDGIAVVVESLRAEVRILDLRTDFHERVRRLLEEAEQRTSSAAERISSMLVEWGIVLATLLALPFPPAALGIGVMVTARSFARAALCWREGDRNGALMFFLVGVTGVVAASGLGTRVLSVLSQQWNHLFPGPSSVLIQHLKNLTVDLGWPLGSKLLSANYKGFNEELLWLLDRRAKF